MNVNRRRSVGSRELKTRLGSYLRKVRQGATLVVTDRGEPVAELRPLPQSATEQDVKLAALEAVGILTRGRAPLKPFRPVRIKGASASQAILEDREDRF